MKNPFDRSQGGGNKTTRNPFDRSKPVEKPKTPPKSTKPITPRSPFAAMKTDRKSSLQRMKEMNEKRKAGLYKEKPKPSVQSTGGLPPNRQAETQAPPEKRTATGAASPKQASEQPTAVRSALGGSGNVGSTSSAVSRPPPDAPKETGTPFHSRKIEVDDKKMSVVTHNGVASEQLQMITQHGVTSANYIEVHKQETQNSPQNSPQNPTQNPSAPSAPPTQQMTSENYTQIYQQQQNGGPPTPGMTSENYTDIYLQQKYNIANFEGMTSENYTEMYQKIQEKKLESEKIITQKVKEETKAVAEVRKLEQQNTAFAQQAQGLQTQISLLRQQLGQGPDVDRGIQSAISQLENALAQIPVGLR